MRHFAALGWQVHGVDNNGRQFFFGKDGDTHSTLHALRSDCPTYTHHAGDVCSAAGMGWLIDEVRPALVIHAAAQPSHDWAAAHPFEDFEINAQGTLNLLEAVRSHAPEVTFIFLSTNKVYGDIPNRLPLIEHAKRYDYAAHSPHAKHGIGEWMSVDASLHSLFGCSKLAADVYVQEYGRYFGMKTVCLRCGCLTGGAHAGAEQHGFLAYLARCCREDRTYRVYGHGGKQVRDNLHASDVARACEAIAYNGVTPGSVYNLGGGRANSCSVLEAIEAVEARCGRKLAVEFVPEPRKGDHVVWISDVSKFRWDYPGWSVRVPLAAIFDELCGVNNGVAVA